MAETSRDAEAPPRTERRSSLAGGRRLVVMALLLAVLIAILVRSLVLEVFYIPSGSMEPTLMPGDRLAVWRLGEDEPQRGEIVVFDGEGSLAPYESGKGLLSEAAGVAGAWLGIAPRDDVFVKRVIGVAGDRVSCCEADGRLSVNGEPVDEPYVMPGDAPSEVSFDVVVPEGRMWVQGDHRSASYDSRELLGAPGGGMIRADTIIGRPVAVLWPLDRIGSVGE